MFLKRSNILRVFQQIKLFTRNFFAMAMDTSFFVCSILEFVGEGGPTATCLLQKCPHQWCSLWFMAYTYSEIFQTNSLVCGFQSNLNNIEIYSYRDLFLKRQTQTIAMPKNLWPFMMHTNGRRNWPSLPLATNIVHKKTHWINMQKTEICLYYGIVCHINGTATNIRIERARRLH